MSVLNILILISLLLIILVTALTTYIIIYKKHYNEIKQRQKSDENENKILNLKILEETDKNLTISKEYFDKGFEVGVTKNQYTIKVDPIENYSGRDYWIYSSEKIEIGFKYTLINNEIPTEFSSTHFTKVISTSKIREENINVALNMIEQIQNLNPGTFIINKSFESIKNKLTKQLIKK